MSIATYRAQLLSLFILALAVVLNNCHAISEIAFDPDTNGDEPKLEPPDPNKEVSNVVYAPRIFVSTLFGFLVVSTLGWFAVSKAQTSFDTDLRTMFQEPPSWFDNIFASLEPTLPAPA